MALPRRERYSHEQLAASSSIFFDNSFPGQQFLEAYQEWTDNRVTLLLPDGIFNVDPDIDGMDSRYNFLLSTFDKDYCSKAVQGAYSEIMAGVILRNIVERETNGEYTIIPTPPQLDVCGRRKVEGIKEKGSEDWEKTADVLFGRVHIMNSERVIEPIMLFDIKSPARGERTSAKIGLGVNVTFIPLPVGIFYLGGMTFTDAQGEQYQAAEYIEKVIHPAILDNTLQWGTLWPDNASHNPRHQLLFSMIQEALVSCCYTREKIVSDSWFPVVKERLVEKILQAEAVFHAIKNSYQEVS